MQRALFALEPNESTWRGPLRSTYGYHLVLVTQVLSQMREQGLGDIPVAVGGIVPPEDAEAMKAQGVAAVFTPKDYDLTAIMAEILALVEAGEQAAA